MKLCSWTVNRLASYIVEIDESNFGKRKYHRHRNVDDVWMCVGIERCTNK